MKLTRLGLLHHGVTRLLLLFSLVAGVATRDDCAADVASFPVTPQSPSNEQYLQLEKVGQLIPLGETTTFVSASGEAVLKFPLPRQAVSLL